MLYPYRPSSVKNQQRWNFGVLCPQSYSEAQKGSEAWTMQTECLVEGSSMTGLEVRVRFLQLVARTVGELTMPVNELSSGEVPEFRLVERLAVDDRVYQPWQEAVEREVILPVYNVEALAYRLVPDAFSFPAEKQFEYLRDGNGQIVGVIMRERKQLCGAVEIMSERVEDGVFKISVRVRNTTPFEVAKDSTRDDALLSSLASTHTVLGVQDGQICFAAGSAGAAQRAGRRAARTSEPGPCWSAKKGNATLCSPRPSSFTTIPRSLRKAPAILFDGTEIDEILSLRIMTLTDDEKREMSQSDERARAMLERTETMPAEQFMKLHGVLRGLRPLKEETQ